MKILEKYREQCSPKDLAELASRCGSLRMDWTSREGREEEGRGVTVIRSTRLIYGRPRMETPRSQIEHVQFWAPRVQFCTSRTAASEDDDYGPAAVRQPHAGSPDVESASAIQIQAQPGCNYFVNHRIPAVIRVVCDIHPGTDGHRSFGELKLNPQEVENLSIGMMCRLPVERIASVIRRED